MFSDGLDFQKAWHLYNTYKHYLKVLAGIGTFLTQDMGHSPLSIVIKMVKCNGKNVAKISDSSGKSMCEDELFMNYLKRSFGVA